jgi:cathepsin F
MKLIVLFALVAIVFGGPYSNRGKVKEYNLKKPVQQVYEEYLSDNKIVFSSQAEKLERFNVFKTNVQIIKKNNNLYPGARFGLNKFALLSKEEFSEIYLSSFKAFKPENISVAPLFGEEELKDIPDAFEWTDRKPPVVTPVKDQGMCGSCWAFSTTGNVEGQWALNGNNLTSLSEQNLVDCDHHCMEFENEQACDGGCDGGLPPNAYAYIMGNGGINTEKSYPYEGSDGTCRFKKDSIGAKVDNWTFVSQDEGQIAAFLYSTGPLSVAVDAEAWQFYIYGVFYLPCGTDLDHAVLMTGYGTETNIFFQTMPYWTVKNSWGSSWGEGGYIYVQRGNGRCGINTYVSTAIINK